MLKLPKTSIKPRAKDVSASEWNDLAASIMARMKRIKEGRNGSLGDQVHDVQYDVHDREREPKILL